PTATFHPRTMAPNAHCAPAPCSARSPMDSAPSGGPSSTPTSAPSSKPHAAVPSEPSKQSVLPSPERPWRRQHSRRKVSNYVEVIDEDLGKSGVSSDVRYGFQRLIAEIGLGKAGLVLSLDASRLTRNNRDWHQLLELCSLFGVLIADGERLYDPAAYHDRLLLGLSGIMSEAELHQIK